MTLTGLLEEVQVQESVGWTPQHRFNVVIFLKDQITVYLLYLAVLVGFLSLEVDRLPTHNTHVVFYRLKLYDVIDFRWLYSGLGHFMYRLLVNRTQISLLAKGRVQ